jgi:phosphonopyruvate decarboxylase
MDRTGRPYALVMQKGSVAAHALKDGVGAFAERSTASRAVIAPHRVALEARPSREEALRLVVAQTPIDSTVLLASTGFCGRELYAIDDRPNHLYMVGSMGCALPLALGLALARPDLRVVALDGDGSALMRMGALATAGAYGPANLLHLLLDNGVHDSTGGQATVSPRVAFADVAAACGYASSLETDDLVRISAWLNDPPSGGARFARLLIRAGTRGDLPRPSMTPVDVKTRLMRHIGVRAGVH